MDCIPYLSISFFKRIAYLIDNAIFKEFCIVLGYSSCAMPQQFGYHFQSNPPVLASGSIGMSGDVRKDRLVYPTEVSDNF